MAIAFTEEECVNIRESLLKEAYILIQEKKVKDITVDELAKSVGISKGAFYKFFSSKEQLFYALLRQMHERLYGPALKMLENKTDDPSVVLTNAILEACKLLDDSKLNRFWEEDAKVILQALPKEELKEQVDEETKLFHSFLHLYDCKVNEEIAINALKSLIYTTSMRKELGDDYPTILLWMASGICEKLF